MVVLHKLAPACALCLLCCALLCTGGVKCCLDRSTWAQTLERSHLLRLHPVTAQLLGQGVTHFSLCSACHVSCTAPLCFLRAPMQTLERSYLLRLHGKVVERPQHMLMRVAIGIHLDDVDEAVKTYHLLR